MADSSTLSAVDGNVIAARLRRDGFLIPVAPVTFSMGSTVRSATVTAGIASGITGTASTGDIIAATADLQTKFNQLVTNVNQLAVIFQLNRMAS